MPKCSFQAIEIAGVVGCVPPLEKCIDDELALFDGNVKRLDRLKKTIGLNKRRVVEPGTTAADLCHAAAEKLLLGLGLNTLPPTTLGGLA